MVHGINPVGPGNQQAGISNPQPTTCLSELSPKFMNAAAEDFARTYLHEPEYNIVPFGEFSTVDNVPFIISVAEELDGNLYIYVSGTNTAELAELPKSHVYKDRGFKVVTTLRLPHLWGNRKVHL